jgi:hypothetical protein
MNSIKVLTWILYFYLTYQLAETAERDARENADKYEKDLRENKLKVSELAPKCVVGIYFIHHNTNTNNTFSNGKTLALEKLTILHCQGREANTRLHHVKGIPLPLLIRPWWHSQHFQTFFQLLLGRGNMCA